jgi:hypothetical protein
MYQMAVDGAAPVFAIEPMALDAHIIKGIWLIEETKKL